MKKYSSPIMKILKVEGTDIVTLSIGYMEQHTTYVKDNWETRLFDNN